MSAFCLKNPLMLIAAITVAACGPDPTAGPGYCEPLLKSNPETATLRIGESRLISATVTHSGKSCEIPIEKQFDWTAESSSVSLSQATDTTVVVTGVTLGTAFVRAVSRKIRVGHNVRDQAESLIAVTQ